MANKTFKDTRFRIDTTTLLTDITSYINQVSIARAMDLIEDTGLNEQNKSILQGLAGTTITINGHVNTTIDAIFGPLINAATSVTKTVEYQEYKTTTNSTGTSGMFYVGEVLLSNVQYSGAAGSLQTFSADMSFDGAVTRTSFRVHGL